MSLLEYSALKSRFQSLMKQVGAELSENKALLRQFETTKFYFISQPSCFSVKGQLCKN